MFGDFLAVCVVVIGIGIFVGAVRKRNEDVAKIERKEEQERIKASKPQSLGNSILDRIFQRQLEEYRSEWRWMSLARGDGPVLVRDSEDRMYLMVTGHYLDFSNLYAYYNRKNWEDGEKALTRFADDLFGQNARYAQELVQMGRIANFLIELKDEKSGEYVLRSGVTSPYISLEDYLLLSRELARTNIWDKKIDQ